MAKPLPVEAIVYGRLPLMITENYPGGTRNAASVTRNDTGAARGVDALIDRTGAARQTGGDALIDRTGAAFPLLNAFGGRTEIENSRPVWLADRESWRTAGLSWARLRFTTESPDECANVVRGYLERRPADKSFTRGLYERGVE
jgi:putative protease